MSQILKTPSTTQAAETAPAPAVTPYQTAAAQLLSAVTAAMTQVGPLLSPHSSTRPRIRANASVDVAFITAAVSAVQNTPELQGVQFDVNEVLDALQFLDAFAPAIKQLEVLVNALKYTVEERKASAGAQALRVYGVTKKYGQDPKLAAVGAQAAILRDALGRTGVKRKAKTPAPPLESGKEVPKP